MLNILDIANRACGLVGLDDAPTREQAKEFCRTRWKLLWGAELWPQARSVASVTLAAGADTVSLPATLELPTLVRRDADGVVVPAEYELAAMLTDPDAFRSRPGAPLYWTQIEPAGGQVRLRFSHAPATAMPLTVIGKRTCPEMANDADMPTIPGADLALIAHVEADLYEWMRQLAKSQAKRSEAIALQSQMLDQANNQAGQVSRFTPWDAGGQDMLPATKGWL